MASKKSEPVVVVEKSVNFGVFDCPICEEPSRLVFETDGLVFTCRPCELAFKFSGQWIKKGNPEKFLEHGKTEPLMMLHGTKDLANAIREKELAAKKPAAEYAIEGEDDMSETEKVDAKNDAKLAAISDADSRIKAVVKKHKGNADRAATKDGQNAPVRRGSQDDE